MTAGVVPDNVVLTGPASGATMEAFLYEVWSRARRVQALLRRIGRDSWNFGSRMNYIAPSMPLRATAYCGQEHKLRSLCY